MDRITALQGSSRDLLVKPVVASGNVGCFLRLISHTTSVCLLSTPPTGLFEEQDLPGYETITWVCHNFASLFKELCEEMFQNSNSGNSHQID